MRWTIPVLILAVTAGAQEQDIDETELLGLARQGMEARLKVGDSLRRQGDLKGAMEAYREATRRFQEALDLLAPREVPAGAVVGVGGLGGAGRLRARRNLRAGGGSGNTENAVALGLKWLAAHQDVEADGRWDAAGFMKHDPKDDQCAGVGSARYSVGVTGLALLAFLGAGYTDRGSRQTNPYAKNVRMGLQFLITSQDEAGCFGPRASAHFIYNHAIATLALCEAYWMTRNPRFKAPARAGLEFLMRARNPYMAWRYGVRTGENDTSVTGWAVMALKSGKYGGFEVDADAFTGARQWIDKATDPKTGQVGYNFPGGSVARPEGMVDRFPAEKSQAMTASGIMTRLLFGERPTSKIVAKGAALCLRQPPRWDPTDGSIDMYYWYWGTLAMFQMGGDAWGKWNEALKEAVVKHQHVKGSGSRTGSWDPAGPWGTQDGGRVYSTALMTLCMEIYYRYDRVHGRPGRPGRPR
ncbi:MAG: prenyltransferase/squalene oxidase repeat-containing protein [Planctomycetota bacterium]|jgi:hypothetical protein